MYYSYFKIYPAPRPAPVTRSCDCSKIFSGYNSEIEENGTRKWVFKEPLRFFMIL
jgi:hypothetical protein